MEMKKKKYLGWKLLEEKAQRRGATKLEINRLDQDSYTPRFQTVAGEGEVGTAVFVAVFASVVEEEEAEPQKECCEDEDEALPLVVAACDKRYRRIPKPTKETTDRRMQQLGISGWTHQQKPNPHRTHHWTAETLAAVDVRNSWTSPAAPWPPQPRPTAGPPRSDAAVATGLRESPAAHREWLPSRPPCCHTGNRKKGCWAAVEEWGPVSLEKLGDRCMLPVPSLHCWVPSGSAGACVGGRRWGPRSRRRGPWDEPRPRKRGTLRRRLAARRWVHWEAWRRC